MTLSILFDWGSPRNWRIVRLLGFGIGGDPTCPKTFKPLTGTGLASISNTQQTAFTTQTSVKGGSGLIGDDVDYLQS